ncbi:hypothetical protein BHE74_00057986 [Ensete ventricosum]|nr:hypothetical protein BHE74_00057986 [Ensete ventricosum]
MLSVEPGAKQLLLIPETFARGGFASRSHNIGYVPYARVTYGGGGALIDRLSRDNVALQAQVRRPEEEKNVTEARAAKLSSQLSQACLRAEEAEQHLIEVCNETDSQVDELNMEHSLALHHAKEADAQVEEACDEEAIDEGIIGKPIVGASHAQWKSK